VNMWTSIEINNKLVPSLILLTISKIHENMMISVYRWGEHCRLSSMLHTLHGHEHSLKYEAAILRVIKKIIKWNRIFWASPMSSPDFALYLKFWYCSYQCSIHNWTPHNTMDMHANWNLMLEMSSINESIWEHKGALKVLYPLCINTTVLVHGTGEWSLVQWLQVLILCGEDVGSNPARELFTPQKQSIHISNPSLPPSMRRRRGWVPSEILQTFP
jgi:hypothetical protein